MGEESRAVIRVLLVDDQPLIRMGFRMVLECEDDIEIVGEADDGAAGLDLCSELEPDVVVMDVRMPGMDGIEATERMAAQCPNTRILILTTYDLDEYAFSGLRAGASGFLLKNARPAELVRAIRVLASGDAIVEPRIMRKMLDLFGERLPRTEDAGEPARAATVRDPRLAALTEREFEIFAAIGRGMTNTEIGGALYLSESTVKTHVGHILMKLALRDRVHAVVLAYETGVAIPGAMTS